MKVKTTPQEKQARTKRRGSVQHSFVHARHIYNHLVCFDHDVFATVLLVEGISYDLKSPEEQLLLNEQFQYLLAGLSSPIQILWRVLPLNVSDYLQHFIDPAPSDDAPEHPQNIWSLLSQSHATLLETFHARRTLLKRSIYLIVRVQRSGTEQESHMQRMLRSRKRQRQHRAHMLEQAQQDLDLIASELMRRLTEMNISVKRLRGPQELVPFYYSCLTPTKADRFPLPAEVIEAIERPIQATMPPRHAEHRMNMHVEPTVTFVPYEEDTTLDVSQLADLIAPAAVTVAPDFLTVEKEYARVVVVQNLPRSVSAGWLRPLADLDEPMEVSFHLQPRQSASMIQQFRRQSRAYHSTANLAQQGGSIEPDTQIAKTDVDDLLMRLASGEERVLSMTILILIRSSSKQTLEERTAHVQSVLHGMLMVSREALFEQDKAFRSMLPHGKNELAGLLLDSRSASTLFPFLSNSLFHPHGILEGMTPQGDPVVLDAWSAEMANANRLLLGPPGWGKSHSMKTTLMRQVLKEHVLRRRTNDRRLHFQAIIIDPEREYSRITNQFGGQVIRLAPGSKHHLNPFDLPASMARSVEHTDRLADHVQKLHTLLEIMLADHTPERGGKLSSSEKGLLDRVIYETYRKVGITSEPHTHDRAAPLMRDVYDVLESKLCGSDPTGLTQRLRRYVHGSLSGLFAGPTNVSINEVIVAFDIHDLETELRPVGLFLVSTFVWVESFQSKIPRQLIVDEAATLMHYESGAHFLEDLVRRARKHYLGVTVISQHAQIFQQSSIPSNCATHVLMRQDATSLDLLEQMFKLSSREVQLLRHLAIGEALLITSNKRLHMRFEASEVEHLLATTDPQEIARWYEQHDQTRSTALLRQLALSDEDTLSTCEEPETSEGLSFVEESDTMGERFSFPDFLAAEQHHVPDTRIWRKDV